MALLADLVQNTLDGLAAGATYALLALGFTLIFGVLRRANLAYGPAIMLGAYAATWTSLQFQVGLAVLALVTVAVAVLAGAYVERLCFAPHRRGAATAAMVASFAIWMQLEELAMIVLPRHLYPFPALYEGAPLGFGAFTLRVESLVILGVGVAACVALWLILHRTRFGVAVRAVIDEPRAAGLAGIHVGRVSFLIFALASALGGIAGFLIAATEAQVTPMLGMWSTLKGMLAMMLGGLGSLPGAVLGGLALGLIEAHAHWFLGPQLRDFAAYLLLFVLLALRPAMDEYALGVLTNIGLFSFVALSAYLLLIAGELSFGQQAFFGVGAYAAGIATAMLGMPLPLGILAAMAAGAAAAALVAAPALRLRGLYFAMATLAAAEMFRILFELFHWQLEVEGEKVGPDGTQGFRGIRWILESGVEPAGFAALVWLLVGLVLLGFLFMESSRLGATIRALGEDPTLAGTLGIDVQRIKLGVAAAAGALAALGGALFAHHNTYIEPRNFDIMLGVHSLAYALIGGLGTALGPLLGVLLDIGVLEASRFLQGYRMIVFGGLVAALLVWRPRGLLDEKVIHWLKARFS